MPSPANKDNKIVIMLVSAENGFHDFDISNAGTIRRVTVSNNIKHGEMFNIYYGDGSYTPHQKEGATWLGRKGVSGYLLGHLEKSIRHSSVFIGESTDSDEFYNMVAKIHCDCQCTEPLLANRNDSEQRTLIAFDLDFPEYSRNSSRNIVYLSECGKCSKALTHGTGVGSFHSTGEDNLKALAEKEAKITIDFDSIITSKSQLI